MMKTWLSCNTSSIFSSQCFKPRWLMSIYLIWTSSIWLINIKMQMEMDIPIELGITGMITSHWIGLSAWSASIQRSGWFLSSNLTQWSSTIGRCSSHLSLSGNLFSETRLFFHFSGPCIQSIQTCCLHSMKTQRLLSKPRNFRNTKKPNG